MKSEELARKLARSEGITEAAARDQVDRVIHNLINGLRNGKAVSIPGLGKLVPKLGQR